MISHNKLFCFGYGYTCTFLGEALKKTGEDWFLAGTTRTAAKRGNLRNYGVEAYTFDRDKPLGDPNLALKDTTHLLISTPPDREGDYTFEAHADDILRQMPNLKWVGYLSTTGVYGDRDGAWVDETSEKRPSSIRGTRRVMAEEQWLSLLKDYKLPVHIFRIAGIYGPGRSAIDSVRVGIARRIIKPGHAFSRIHVEDLVAAIIASMHNPSPGQIYNLADDEAAPSHEVIAYAARLLGKEPPPLVRFEDANLAPITLSFYSDNKRVHNDKIKEKLGVVLKYPNYRVGLESCLALEKFYADKGVEPPWSVQVGPEFAGQIAG
jgi:hypothetical protein